MDKRQKTPRSATPTAPAAEQTPPPPVVAWTLPEFMAAVRVPRATMYALPDPLQPRSVWIGRKRLVVEPPAEYVARLAAAGPIALVKTKAAA